jgi:cell division septation protein DedD
MDSSLKQRLVGAVVLVALGVIFLPMLVKGPAPDSGVTDVSLDVPPEPQPQGETASVDLPLVGPGAAPAGGATGMPAAVQEAPADPAAAADAPLFPATAGGDYAVTFGSYATAADADKVIAALRSAELPAWREVAATGGKPLQRVRIGPFADRALAESARLRAAHVSDTVEAKVIALDAVADAAPAPAAVAPAKPAPTPAPAPAPTKPAAKPEAPKPVAAAPAKPAATAPVAAPATGFAVQVGAFASTSEATKLRDRLRAAGFNAFTDSVATDKGTLTRVRVGPAMTRAEADALKAQVKAKLGVDGIVRPHP